MQKKNNKKFNKKTIRTIAQILCLSIFSLTLGFCESSKKKDNDSNQSDIFSFPNSNAALTVTFGDATITTQIASGGQGTGAITYTSSNPDLATVIPDTGAVMIVNEGEVIITAIRAADETNKEATASYTLTVAKGDDVLSFPSADFIGNVGSSAITTQIAKGGEGTGAITYASDTPTVVTVDAMTGEITIVSEGKAIITATRAADETHEEATTSYALIVGPIVTDPNKQNDTLSFPNDNADVMAAVGDATITNQIATATSEREGITYVSSDTAIATVDENSGEITIVEC